MYIFLFIYTATTFNVMLLEKYVSLHHATRPVGVPQVTLLVGIHLKHVHCCVSSCEGTETSQWTSPLPKNL